MTQVLRDREPEKRIPRSKLERKFFRLLERNGLPLPVKRYKVRLPDGRVVEIDFAWPRLLLGIEVDGGATHAHKQQRAADNIRQADLEDLGWMLRRFTWEQVERDERTVLSVVRRALVTAENRL
jgi:very-short-patch-repair endonuclease